MAVKKLWAKTHLRNTNKGIRQVLAVCDDDLLGKVYRSGGKRLDLVLYKQFYEGELVSFEQAVDLLKNAGNINLVGVQSIKAAGKAFALDERAVKKIGGVPHLQLYRI